MSDWLIIFIMFYLPIVVAVGFLIMYPSLVDLILGVIIGVIIFAVFIYISIPRWQSSINSSINKDKEKQGEDFDYESVWVILLCVLFPLLGLLIAYGQEKSKKKSYHAYLIASLTSLATIIVGLGVCLCYFWFR